MGRGLPFINVLAILTVIDYWAGYPIFHALLGTYSQSPGEPQK
jgi:hypothetical protein